MTTTEEPANSVELNQTAGGSRPSIGAQDTRFAAHSFPVLSRARVGVPNVSGRKNRTVLSASGSHPTVRRAMWGKLDPRRVITSVPGACCVVSVEVGHARGVAWTIVSPQGWLTSLTAHEQCNTRTEWELGLCCRR